MKIYYCENSEHETIRRGGFYLFFDKLEIEKNINY